MAHGADELTTALGATPPPALEALAPGDRAALAGLLERADSARAAALDKAVHDSLRHLPPLLRRPVRKALGL